MTAVSQVSDHLGRRRALRQARHGRACLGWRERVNAPENDATVAGWRTILRTQCANRLQLSRHLLPPPYRTSSASWLSCSASYWSEWRGLKGVLPPSPSAVARTWPAPLRWRIELPSAKVFVEQVTGSGMHITRDLGHRLGLREPCDATLLHCLYRTIGRMNV